MNIIDSSYEISFSKTPEEVISNLERIARTCYKSEDLITPESGEAFIDRLMNRGHTAMIEHESITVKLICDRGISHEAVRHRIASFAQESTRYCNYMKGKFGAEITVISIWNGMKLDPQMQNLDESTLKDIWHIWLDAMNHSERAYLKMLNLGCSPQMARSVLPNSLKTELVITMNLRSWLNFFDLREPVTAHPQMRELVMPAHKDFKIYLPVIFDRDGRKTNG